MDEIRQRLEKEVEQSKKYPFAYEELCVKLNQHLESFEAGIKEGMKMSRKRCWDMGADAERNRILELINWIGGNAITKSKEGQLNLLIELKKKISEQRSVATLREDKK